MDSVLSHLPISLPAFSAGSSSSHVTAEAPRQQRVTMPASEDKLVVLGDVLARQVGVHWPEAVAIVAELCATLASSGRSGGQVPEVSAIGITAEGSVTVTGAGTNPITSLGRMLHALLATGNTPTPLRLFVSHAIASARYESVETFAAALAYYEVPGRQALIQAVYHRTLAAQDAPAVPIDRLINFEVEEQKLAPAQTATADVVRRRVPRWAIAAAAVLLCAVAALGFWYWGGRSSQSMLRTFASQATATVQKLGQELRQSVGLGLVPSTTVEEPQRADAARPNSRRRDRQPSTTAALAAMPAALPIDSEATGEEVYNIEPPAAVAVDAEPIPARALPVSNVKDDRIYTIASPEVTPPVTVLPQLPRTQPSGSMKSVISTIEVVVSETGRVDRVRLISYPSKIQAAMLLSAAKAWKFEPAMHDGRAVKYRLLLKVPVSEPK